MGIKIIDKNTGNEIKVGGSQATAPPVNQQGGKLVIRDISTGKAASPTVGQRVTNTVSGAVKQSAASWGDSASTMYAAGQKHRDNQNDWYRREYQMQYDDAERDYRFMMEDNAAEPGTWSQGDIDSALNRMAAAKTKLDAMGYVVDNKVQERATEAARDTMHQVEQSGAEDIEKAKEGLGAGGRFLVDLGVGATQLATDAAANYLLFGGARLPNGKLRPNSTLGAKMAMGGRVFGGSTMQARQDGASLGEQISYGGAMTALEMGLEMLGGLDSVYGKGATTNFAGKLISKLTKNPAGQKVLQVLSTAGSEGTEEFLSGVLSPAMQSIYDGKSVGSHYSLDTLTDAAYEALVGGALGGIGGTVDVVGDPLAAAMFGKGAQRTTQEAAPNAAGERTATPTGTDTTQAENPAQGTQTQDGLMAAMFGQDTENAASGTETAVTVKSGQSAINERSQEKQTLAYTLATNLDQVRDMEPVSQLTGREMNERSKTIPEQISEFFKSLGNKVFRNGLGDVELGEYGVGGVMNHKPINRAKLVSLAAVPNVIRNGRQIGYDPDWKGRGYPSYIFAAPVMVGDTEVFVAAVVDQRPDNKFYLSEMVDSEGNYVRIEESPSSNSKNGVTEGAGQASGVGVTAGPEGLSMEGNPLGEAPNPLPPVNSTISQPADSVNSAPEAQGESGHTNTVGAAEAGFLTPDSQSTERVSNINSGAAAFTGREGEATGLSRADYDNLFRYQTETEEQRRQYANSLLYYEQDGKRVFLGDIDPEGYQQLVDYLTNAPAWNGVMTDTAMLIKQEMLGRSLADPMFDVPDGGLGVTQEDYTNWLKVLREHATDTGRGTQAWAAWTRRDNDHGQATELEAWENLENSNLSDDERREVFESVVKYDQAIEQAKTTEDLSNIIMQIADQRGTTNGLTGKQSKRLTDRARKALDSMSFEELKQLAYSSSSALTTDRNPADTGRKLKTIQILNMLSSPKTATTNLTGNTSFYGIDAMAMRGAAVLDIALSKLTGTRSVAMEGFVGSKQSRADIGKAIQRSLAEITLDVDMGGEGRYQQGSQRTFKANGAGVFNTGTAADRFVERVLSVLERNMGYAMTTTDEGYKGAARSTAHATQKLVDEGKIKTGNKDYATERAEDLAKYRTFQRDGRLATTLHVVHDLCNMIGIGDSGKKMGGYKVHSFGVGDLVAPFTRVAGNLVSTAVDYNPAKAVQGTVEIIDAIRKAQSGDINPATQAKAVSDTARGLTGTMISLAAMALVKAGIIKRAEDEDDEDVAALNQSEGMTGTQINVDAAMRWVSGGDAEWQAGDTLVDVSRLEPLNFLFSFGVELANNENDGILSTVGEVAGDAASAFVSAAGDLPVMGTVAGVAKDVLVYGDDPLTAAAENLGKTAISSATPNVMAAMAKGLDDKQRSTYSGDGVRDVLIDTLFSRIPGARQTLPTVVNSLGEEKDNPGNLGVRLFNSMLNPIGVNEYSQSEVSQEMERVREKTGETSFYPSKSIPSKLTYTKDGVQHETELTWEQRQQYQMARSGAQMSVSAAMLGSPAYRNADAKTQAALLDRVHDYANQFARGQVLGEDSMEGWVRNSQAARADLGVSQAEFFCLYEKYGSEIMGGTAYEKTKRMVKAGLSVDQWATMKGKVDTDGNGSVKKAEVESYIERNFPRAKWRQLFDAYKGSSNWKNPY